MLTTIQKQTIALAITITVFVIIGIMFGKKLMRKSPPNTEYFNGLSETQKENISILMDEMDSGGITNPMTKAAILSVISKESRFIPQGEVSYARTSNYRIRTVFGSRVAHLSESQLSSVKQNPKQFFDTVYGGWHGNAPNEGYKYRGRGYNQLTFKGNYARYAKETGVDIVRNPDLVNDPRIAAKVAVTYFKRQFAVAKQHKKKEYNFTNINSFNSLDDALMAVYNSNAGWGKSQQAILKDTTGGLKKAKERVEGFYQWLS